GSASDLSIDDTKYPIVLEIGSILLTGSGDGDFETNIRVWHGTSLVGDQPPTSRPTKRFPAYGGEDSFVGYKEPYTKTMHDWTFVCGPEYKGRCPVTMQIRDMDLAYHDSLFLKTWTLEASKLPIKDREEVRQMEWSTNWGRQG